MISWLQVALIGLLMNAAHVPSNTTQGKLFRVHFEQDLKTIDADDLVTLKKEPFDVVFEFPAPMGVLVHASYNPETYDLALDGKPMKKLPGFENTGMAESKFNEDNEILLNATAPGYWYYDSEEDHRFDEVTAKAGTITCKRRVEFFNEVDSNRIMQVTDATAPLHLVFISYERSESDKEAVETHRVPVRIEWED